MQIREHADVHLSVEGGGFTAVVFPGARVDRGARIMDGAFALPGCHVEPGATLGRDSIAGRGSIVRRGSFVPPGRIVPDGSVYPDDPLFGLTTARYYAVLEEASDVIDALAEQPGPHQKAAQRLSSEPCGMSPGRLLPWVGAIADLYEAYLAEMRKGFTPEEWEREVALAQARFDAEEAAREAA